MSESKIYVIGHKSPDLDSVAAAISYARLKNILENTDIYVPAMAGEPNQETQHVLKKYGIEKPELLASAAGQTLILVDHNEASQMVEGANEAKIVEVLDHHKFNFSTSEPITITNKPWGSSSTIIKKIYGWKNVAIDKNMAGLMLSAILVDTVITKSPTCTDIDREVISELAQLANIDDWKEYGIEIFKIRSNVKRLPIIDIIKSDFKDFIFKAGKFGIGQVETVDLEEFKDLEPAILDELAKIKDNQGYHSVVLFITDIMKEGSKFLIATNDRSAIESSLGHKLEDNKVWIDGIFSRKKQVAPLFSEHFDK